MTPEVLESHDAVLHHQNWRQPRGKARVYAKRRRLPAPTEETWHQGRQPDAVVL